MKKGLLSVLALAVTIVGCQNYDDQFDALNTQISALKSQVDGLAAVQSAVTALQGQLSALSSSALTSADLDAALTSGLADIIADVEAVQAAVADVASAADVDAISDSLTDAQADLDELLASSSVFNNSIVINSVSTLDVYHSMGNSINIVNGDVTITMKTDMDHAKMQEVVDKILTITGDYSYTSNSSSIAEIVFTNLTGTQSLTVEQAGGYQFPVLSAATNIDMGDAYENSITTIDFGDLTSVTYFKTEGVNNKILFDNATTIDLGSLGRYGNSTATDALTITTDEGGSLIITSLDDVDAAGDQDDLHLNITGPETLSFSNILDGTMTFTDVKNVTVSGFIGDITVGLGVEVLNVTGGVSVDVSGATDLTGATINMALDSDENLTAAQTAALPYGSQGDLSFSSAADDLSEVSISGEAHNITLDGLGNLTTVTLAGKANDVTIANNDDLTSVTVTDLSARNITVNANSDLENIALDHTTILTKAAATADKAAEIVITNNNKLTSAAVHADDIDVLTITGNAKLTTLDFKGETKELADNGTSTAATVNIYDNKLIATVATDAYQATLTAAQVATASDLGDYTHETGIDELTAYITDAAGATTPNIKIFFDEVESLVTKGATTAADVETTPATVDWSTAPTTTDANNIHCLVYITPAGANTNAKYQTATWLIDMESEITAATQALSETDFDATADDISITYPALGATNFAYDATDRNTLADYITWFNTEADKESFDATLALTGKLQKYYQITYTETDGTNGAVSEAGKIYFDYGTDTGLSTSVYAGDNPLEVASQIAGVIHGLASFTAKVMGNANAAFVVVGGLTDSGELEAGPAPRRISLPGSLTVSKTYTGGTGNLASWSANATNAETSYTLSFGSGVARYSGLLLTMKHTNTAQDRMPTTVSTAGSDFFGTVSKLNKSSFYANGNVDGSSTTTVDSEIGGYIRDFADASAFQGGAAGQDTNRMSWTD